MWIREHFTPELVSMRYEPPFLFGVDSTVVQMYSASSLTPTAVDLGVAAPLDTGHLASFAGHYLVG